MLWLTRARKWTQQRRVLVQVENFQADKMFFHRAPLAFIIFFLVAAVLFFCFLAYFYLWMCCRKRYRLKEQKKQATAEKKANAERFHDLSKPEDNEETAKGNKFYPIVFHNKKLETAELRLLWKESNIIGLHRVCHFRLRCNNLKQRKTVEANWSVLFGFCLVFYFDSRLRNSYKQC